MTNFVWQRQCCVSPQSTCRTGHCGTFRSVRIASRRVGDLVMGDNHRGGVMAKAVVLLTTVLFFFFPLAHAQHRASASNMTLLGHDDLQARSAYQPVVHAQGERWIAYVGHHGGRTLNRLTGRDEDNGTSIIEETDP